MGCSILNLKANGFGFSHLRLSLLVKMIQLFVFWSPSFSMIRWMWFLPVGGLPCGWPVARVTPAWWNCCFQLELTKIKWNSTWMAGPIWWKGVFQRLGWEMQSTHFLCFYFRIDVFMIHDILVLLFTSIYYFLTENHRNNQIQTPPPFRIFLLGETLPYHFPGWYN